MNRKIKVYAKFSFHFVASRCADRRNEALQRGMELRTSNNIIKVFSSLCFYLNCALFLGIKFRYHIKGSFWKLCNMLTG